MTVPIETLWLAVGLASVLIIGVVIKYRSAPVRRGHPAGPPPTATPAVAASIKWWQILIATPMWILFTLILGGCSLQIIDGCVLPKVQKWSGAAVAPLPPASAPVASVDISDIADDPVTSSTEVADQVAAGDWKQTWVTTMVDQIKAQQAALKRAGLGGTYEIEDLGPNSRVIFNPHRAAGRAVVVGPIVSPAPAHAWVTTNGAALQIAGSTGHPAWVKTFDGQRILSEGGDSIALLRWDPAVAPPDVDITYTLMRAGESTKKSDVTTQPDKLWPAQVRLAFRGVGQGEKVALATQILTELPEYPGQRIDSHICVALVGHDGYALPPLGDTMTVWFNSTTAVDYGSEFTTTTAGKNSPQLIVAPLSPGEYDIIVVFTPMEKF